MRQFVPVSIGKQLGQPAFYVIAHFGEAKRESRSIFYCRLVDAFVLMVMFVCG